MGLIGGMVGLPGGTESGNVAAAGGPPARLGTPRPTSAFGGSALDGSFHDTRLISEPVGISGPDGAGGSNQLHQLVAAMASFGSDGASAIGAAVAQTEVEVARMTLAASLHF